ncbi:solute carrier family facilitated glucose transporter member 11-like protein [Labeo rohita]|uniref:Solute carrier family facilitated glucose transporter member 11-like protein n=1 Tax=Labeo rohita TaxID=84645 RepID=A0A498NUS2_LABRO|nr:solute carrier family facilitated glucose transporter member 11-like protein [Labeo rohita]
MIILARLLVGVNAGVSMNVQPMCFGESAPKNLRGAVAFSSAVFTAFGILMGQVTGLTEVLGSESLWPYLLASNALPGLVQLVTLPWFPESPRFLLIDRGDREACGQALKRLRACSVFTAEMEEILQERAGAGEARAKTLWEMFSDQSLRRQSMVCMFAYILSFGMGPAGVTGILPAELFDQMARPAAYMVAGSMMWLNLFLIGMAFPFIVNGLGQFCFIPFCGVCVTACLSIGFTLPETKGRTLAEITEEFEKRNKKGTANGLRKYGEQSQSLTDLSECLETDNVSETSG